jgi:hypothetical protein
MQAIVLRRVLCAWTTTRLLLAAVPNAGHSEDRNAPGACGTATEPAQSGAQTDRDVGSREIALGLGKASCEGGERCNARPRCDDDLGPARNEGRTSQKAAGDIAGVSVGSAAVRGPGVLTGGVHPVRRRERSTAIGGAGGAASSAAAWRAFRGGAVDLRRATLGGGRVGALRLLSVRHGAECQTRKAHSRSRAVSCQIRALRSVR